MQPLVSIGIITKPHGLRGDFKFQPFNEHSNTLKKGLHVFLKDGDDLVEHVIAHLRNAKDCILRFEGFDSIESVENFRNTELFVQREALPTLADGEHYLFDLIGMELFNEGESIATVEDVLSLGHADLLLTHIDKKEVLIPIVDEFVRLIDIEKKQIHIHLMDGLVG